MPLINYQSNSIKRISRIARQLKQDLSRSASPLLTLLTMSVFILSSVILPLFKPNVIASNKNNVSDPVFTVAWDILTPDGYKDISQISVGGEVIGYDAKTGEQIINTIEKIELVSPKKYNYWEQDEEGNNTNYIEVPFTYYVINNKYQLFKDQSLFANNRLIHAFELKIGDAIYTQSGEETITALSQNNSFDQWVRLVISGNHSYVYRLSSQEEQLYVAAEETGGEEIVAEEPIAETTDEQDDQEADEQLEEEQPTDEPEPMLDEVIENADEVSEQSLNNNNQPDQSNNEINGLILHNASRYWVGGGSSANWSATSNTNWGSASNTQDNASVPGSSDDVIFDGIGTGASNSTISANITINSLDMTGYENILTHNSSGTLTIAGDTFTLSANMIYTLGSVTTSALSFTSTTGTEETPTIINANGKITGNVTINGAGGYFQLAGNLTTGATATLTYTQGTFNAGGYYVTIGLFSSSNSNARTLIMGDGIWTVTGNNATIWTMGTATGLTLNRGNDVVLSYNGGTGTRTVYQGTTGGSEAVSVGFKVTSGTDTFTISSHSGQRIHNLIFDGFAGTFTAGTRNIYGNFIITENSADMILSAGSNVTTFAGTGEFIVDTYDKTIDFPITFNNSSGAWQLDGNLTMGSTTTLTFTAGTFDAGGYDVTIGLFSSTGVITRTLTMGSGIWTVTGNNDSVWQSVGTVTFNKGNNPIIFNYSGSEGTRTISTGIFSASLVPDINITAGSDTVILTTNMGNLDFTGFSGTLANSNCTVYGNIVFSVGMTLASGDNSITLAVDNFGGIEKWRGGVLGNDGKIYGMPYYSSGILIIDPEAGTATTSNMGADLSDTNKFESGALANNGKIYGMPYYTSNILIIDPEAGTATTSDMGADLSLSNVGNSYRYRGGSLASNGKIYGMPNSANTILIIDPEAGTATTSDMGADLSGTYNWHGGVMANDGKIYGMPYGMPTILIIDPEAGTATTSDMGADLTGSAKWSGGVLGNDGKIYGIPNNATDILIIDTVLGTATTSDMGADLSDSKKWWGGVLGSDGKIYGIPNNATDILIIDTVLGTATRTDMNINLSGNNKYAGGILGPDNKIYCFPHSAGDILIIDPVLGTAVRSLMGAITTSGTRTITTNGQTLDFPLIIQGEGGTFELADDLTLGSDKSLSVLGGTFNTNNHNITAGSLNFSGIDQRTVNLGSSIITLTGSGSALNNNVAANLNLNNGTSEIIFATTSQSLLGDATFHHLTVSSDADLDANNENITVSGNLTNNGVISNTASTVITLNGSSSQTIALNRATVGNLTVTNSNILRFTNGFTISGALTNNTPGSNMIFNASSVYNIGSLALQGSLANRISLTSSSGGSPYYFNLTSGNSSISYVSVSDSNASRGVNITASNGTNLDSGGNFNWLINSIIGGGGLSVFGLDNALPYNPSLAEPQENQLQTDIEEANQLAQNTVLEQILDFINKPRNKLLESEIFQVFAKQIPQFIDQLETVKEIVSAYISYGTPATVHLGAGERFGTLLSFISAFSKLPSGEQDWNDIFNIANGKWPVQKSSSKEEAVKNYFKKIYQREPRPDSRSDKNAIDIMAYGIRPKTRNLNNELVAIGYYTAIFKKIPYLTQDWDIVRAIAYSGAKR